MPRKAFLQDLASIPGTISHVADIAQGKELGIISFVYLSAHLPTGALTIQAEIPEVSDYPVEHYCFLYTNSDEQPPPSVSLALANLSPSLNSRNLSEMLTIVVSTLNRVLDPGQADASDDVEEIYDDEDLDVDDDEDDQMFGGDPQAPQTIHDFVRAKSRKSVGSVSIDRIRSDLRAAKSAGFKVGILGSLDSGGVLCISVHVTKLGVSEEAMHAWGLRRKYYLVLMIRFQERYQTLEQISEEPNLGGKTQMRVALCERYKPSLQNALNAFTQIAQSNSDSVSTSQKGARGHSKSYSVDDTKDAVLEPLFIGRPLNDLLRDRFPGIVKYRLACAYSWSGAENFYNDIQGKSINTIDSTEEKYYAPENIKRSALPRIVTADTIADTISGKNISMPLVGIQFVLRHLVRCTEFCLVCHCRVEATFEALKPYVCSKPLCLYQYMALGFGPSIEWEIITQPYVVDLLVSFCYASAASGRLKDFPTGIAMKIPLLPQLKTPLAEYLGRQQSPKPSDPLKATELKCEKSFSARVDQAKSELLLDDFKVSPVKIGDWLVVQSRHFEGIFHYRVAEVHLFPTIRLDGNGVWVTKGNTASPSPYPSQAVNTTKLSEATAATAPSPLEPKAGLIEVDVYLYDYQFDQLPDSHKKNCITMLLDTMPRILKLREHLLEGTRGQDPSLRSRKCDLSESTLNLLRWIIASNRSCIMQVDKLSDKHKGELSLQRSSLNMGNAEDRVSGMDEWMQFRFAQGAPDKEQRFIDCVDNVAARTKKFHPTIFAFHGSPLANWHGIVREGLHFNDTLHGRAYGHGVYMAADCNTSMVYCNPYGGMVSWPHSDLRISSAMALNEVVNAPEEYVQSTACYVVSQLDWIQTRYLFVKATTNCHTVTTSPTAVYQQDPTRTARGQNGTPLIIPITAVSKSRRPVTTISPQQIGDKKAKTLWLTNQQSAENAQDDAESVISDLSDREYLESDLEEEDVSTGLAMLPITNGARPKRKETLERTSSRIVDISVNSQTDFVPGSLDLSKLKMLKEPRSASVNTTKLLMKAFKEVLKAQQTTPLHELGWYIDGSKADNVYQWIIELHSFDLDLPLSVDMKKAGLKSIVLEMRFTNSFPFAPPFVRVVRPRFLPFQQGGGGHVTAGGAICMELLTNNGWLVTNTIESVLMQIRMAISSTEPNPARLMAGAKYGGDESYGVGEAIEAYKRACALHGWTVPKDFDTL